MWERCSNVCKIYDFLFWFVRVVFRYCYGDQCRFRNRNCEFCCLRFKSFNRFLNGLFCFLTNVFFFVLQVIVDSKDFLKKALRQLPICFVFGMIFDIALWVSGHIVAQNYWQQLLMAFFGSILTGLGIASMVFARLAILPPEGFVLAIMNR